MKIAVVGLGIAGLSACVRLARAGHEVEGFEQFALMHERGSSHGDTRIFRLTPGEGEIYVRMAERGLTGWRDWEQRAGKRLLSSMPGVMAGPPGSAFVASCKKLSEAYQHPAVFLTGADAETATQGAIRMPADWEICLQRDCGVLHADAARAFLIDEAQRLTARLWENTAIRAPIEGAALHLESGPRTFDAIIVAAGAWTRELLAETAALLTPKRRVMGWFRPSAPLETMPPVLCVDDAVGAYGMPTPDGFYKLGLHSVGDVVDPDGVREPDAADAALLAAQAAAYLPLHDPNPVRMKRCIYTLTPDENFIAAPSPENANVFILSCCSGHGFKYAPLYGEMALDWIEDRATPELAAFGLHDRIAHATKLGGG